MLQRLVARRPWNTVEDRARNIRWLQQRGFRWEDIQRALPDGPVDEG
jgi:SOS response regulatory protein OraA/RecX